MTWTNVLDALERHLQRQHVAFRGSGALPDPVRLDVPAVPMTNVEQVRAIDLLQRHDELISSTLAVMKQHRTRSSTPYSG